jgi:hypothetical protein
MELEEIVVVEDDERKSSVPASAAELKIKALEAKIDGATNKQKRALKMKIKKIRESMKGKEERDDARIRGKRNNKAHKSSDLVAQSIKEGEQKAQGEADAMVEVVVEQAAVCADDAATKKAEKERLEKEESDKADAERLIFVESFESLFIQFWEEKPKKVTYLSWPVLFCALMTLFVVVGFFTHCRPDTWVTGAPSEIRFFEKGSTIPNLRDEAPLQNKSPVFDLSKPPGRNRSEMPAPGTTSSVTREGVLWNNRPLTPISKPMIEMPTLQVAHHPGRQPLGMEEAQRSFNQMANSITHLMVLCLWLISIYILLSFLWGGVKHTYQFKGWDWTAAPGGPTSDMRADSNSVHKLKHRNALVADIEHVKWIWPRVWRFEFFDIRRKTTQMKVSLEVLVQLTTAANIPINTTDQIVAERLQYAGNALQSVNVIKWKAALGEYVVQDAERMAYALWKQMTETRKSVPFPRAPAINA